MNSIKSFSEFEYILLSEHENQNNGPVICITPVSITKQDRRVSLSLFPYPIYNYRYDGIWNRSFEIELKRHQNLIYLGQVASN